MADFADEASALADLHLAAALSRPRAQAAPFSGFCLACREPVEERRYCDSDCRADHEIQLKRSRRS